MKTVAGRVIVSCDMQGKNSHQFKDGTKIFLGRQYNNLNRRETEPINCFVIDAENIPIGAEVLVHHNSLHDVNKIFNYKPLGGESIRDTVEYFSLLERECYLWRIDNGPWHPSKGYATGLRVFIPYEGEIVGIEHKKVKNHLYITSGEYAGQVCQTVKAADYEMIFQGDDGREKRVIRCRHFEDEYHEREEIIAINHELTNLVREGKYFIGLNVSDAKPLKQNKDAIYG